MPRGGARNGAGRKAGGVAKKTVARQAVKEAQRRRLATEGITPDRVLKELARLGFADIREVVSWSGNVTEMGFNEDTGEMNLAASNRVALVDSDKLSADAAAAVAEVSQTKEGALKVKMHDKKAPLIALAKHLGLFDRAKPRPETEQPDAPNKPTVIDGWDGLLQ